MSDVWLKISGAAGAKIYNLLLSVATLSLTARLLGPEGRGEIAAVLAWVTLFSTIGHLSLGSVAIHQLTLERSAARVSELFGSLLIYAALLTLLSWIVAAALYSSKELSVFGALPAGLLAIGFLNLPFLLWQMYGQSLLMGLDRASYFNRSIMTGRTVNLAAVYLAVGWFAWGTIGAMGAAVLASVVTAAGGFLVLFKQANRRLTPSLKCIATLSKGATRLHLNAIGTYLFTQSGVLVVNHYHGAASTGNYQLAAQLIVVMLIIPTAVSQTLFSVVTQRGPDEAWPINRHVLHRSMLITGLRIAVPWLFAPYLIRLIAGPGFDEAVGQFRLMLPMLLGATLSSAMAPQWIGRGLFWQASLLTLFVGLCSICVSLVLTPRLGSNGAIYATLVGYAIGAIFNVGLYIHCSRRHASASGKDNENPAG